MRRNKSHKREDIPKKYEVGFLRKLDKRTDIAKRLNLTFSTIVQECGGYDQISEIRLNLIERYIFLNEVLRRWEHQIATDPKSSEKLLSRWTQCCNAASGLGRAIGLQISRPKKSLTDYVAERSRDV